MAESGRLDDPFKAMLGLEMVENARGASMGMPFMDPDTLAESRRKWVSHDPASVDAQGRPTRGRG